jgi:hypothetical protein
MLKFIGWMIDIVLLCWATVSAFSIFSELKFLVDGWTWSVGQVPISIKAVALTIGKWANGIVGGYRAFIHELVQISHLPRLPQIVYDVGGAMTFSIGRGYWLGRRASYHAKNVSGDYGAALSEARKKWVADFKEQFPILEIASSVLFLLSRKFSTASIVLLDKISIALVYGGLVAIVIAVLFGIDYLYRHVA